MSNELAQRGAATWQVGDLDLIIPVYKNKALVERCLASLHANLAEVAGNKPRVIVVNDSPDDRDVTEFLKDLKSKNNIHLLIENDRNIGFVKSVNKALAASRERRASAVLINSDTETFPGTLAELVAVADLDDQFGFVCPRSNNASICTIPRPPHARAGTTLSPQSTFDAWNALKDLLPRFAYAPTAIGFYMLIKSVVIRNFDALDEKFGVGYEEENDLVMRAGKVGFRAVIANHAFAYHAGSASFSLTDIGLDDHREANLKKITEKHPEFLPNVRAFEASPEFRADAILKGLLPASGGKLDIAFVLFPMGRFFNGTNEFIVSVLTRFVEAASGRFNITLLCYPETAKFHGLDELPGVRITSSIDDVYAVALSFGQPYDLHLLNIMEMSAPVVIYSMLDVISLDCGPLRHSQKVSPLWEYAAETSNGLIFISQFSRDTFVRRFPATTARLFTRLLSTDPNSYSERYGQTDGERRHILVAGNHFAHKDSTRAGKLLAKAFPSLSFVVFGEKGAYPANAQPMQPGSVDDDAMQRVLRNSSAVVLPSFYEGFGFTFMHALALGKPIVARDIPATREIIAKFEGLTGVFLFSDDMELQDALAKALDAQSSSFRRQVGDDWQSWAGKLVEFLDEVLADRAGIYPLVVKRLKRGDELRSRASAKSVTVAWEELAALPDERFVERLYELVLGRPADDSGKAHHLTLLKEGHSRPDLARALLNCQESRESARDVTIDGLPERNARRPGIVGAMKSWLGLRHA